MASQQSIKELFYCVLTTHCARIYTIFDEYFAMGFVRDLPIVELSEATTGYHKLVWNIQKRRPLAAGRRLVHLQ